MYKESSRATAQDKRRRKTIEKRLNKKDMQKKRKGPIATSWQWHISSSYAAIVHSYIAA